MRLDIRIDSERRLDDGSIVWLARVPRAQLVRFGFILEALDGWCAFSTVERGDNCVARITAPGDWAGNVRRLLGELGAEPRRGES